MFLSEEKLRKCNESHEQQQQVQGKKEKTSKKRNWVKVLLYGYEV